MKNHTVAVFSFFSMLFISTQSLSGALDNTSNYKENQFSIGLALALSSSMYVDARPHQQSVPIVNWNYNNWFLKDYRFGSYLYGGDKYFLSASIGVESISPVSNKSTKAKSNNNATVYNGSLSLGLFDDWGLLETSYFKDVSREHNSHTISVSYSYELLLGSLVVQPSIKFIYLPANVINYYLNSNHNDSVMNRKSQSLSDTYVSNFDIYANYHFNKSHSAIFGIGWDVVPNEIKNSPLSVNKKVFQKATLGYVYAF